MATPLEPNRPGPDAVDADALAVPGGVRPVVWLADAAAPDALSPQLARALLDEHTRRGAVVVDIDDDVAFAAAAAEAARRHHALGGGHRLAPLAVAVSVPAAHRISHLSALTGAAHAVGLRQVRHVAVVHPGPTPGSGRHRGGGAVAPPSIGAGDLCGHAPAAA